MLVVLDSAPPVDLSYESAAVTVAGGAATVEAAAAEQLGFDFAEIYIRQ